MEWTTMQIPKPYPWMGQPGPTHSLCLLRVLGDRSNPSPQ